MTTQTKEAKDQYIYRNTNKTKGRSIAISPQNSSMTYLGYGRIILDSEVAITEFDTGEREVGLICLSGKCSIEVDRQANVIDQYDSIYIPRGSHVKVTTESHVDLVECSAPVDNQYPLQIVRYGDVKNNSSLSFDTGSAANKRRAGWRRARIQHRSAGILF